jgi:hypothetical protein
MKDQPEADSDDLRGQWQSGDRQLCLPISPWLSSSHRDGCCARPGPTRHDRRLYLIAVVPSWKIGRVVQTGLFDQGLRHSRGGRRSRNNLAIGYRAAGRLGEAISLHEQVLAARERVQGPDHPSTLNSRNNLAAYRAAGRTDKAGDQNP